MSAVPVIAILVELVLHSVSAEVRIQPTSLLSGGRKHPCPGELLVFTCESNGTYLDWKFNTVYRAIFFSDQRVDEIQTVSGSGFKFHSILTGNEAHTGTPPIRRLTSLLLLQLSELDTEPHNITCSSDTELQVVRFRTSEMPNAPGRVIVNKINSLQQSYSSLIRWNAPDNIDEFDLDHYKIQISSSKPGVEMALNVSSTTVEYPFGLLVNSTILHSGSVSITISAVTKCLQQGQFSAPVMLQGTGSHSTPSADSQLNLHTNGNGFTEFRVTIVEVVLGMLIALFFMC